MRCLERAWYRVHPNLLLLSKDCEERLCIFCNNLQEVIIWTEMTNFQRSYYKALFENQIGALLGGGKQTQLPNLRNLAMELRKVCCHPVRPTPLRCLMCLHCCAAVQLQSDMQPALAQLVQT